MPKRQYHLSVKCSEPNCREVRHYLYDTRIEYNEAYVRHQKDKCSRHSQPEKVLSIDNITIVSEQTVKTAKDREEKYFDGKGLVSSFTTGYAYRAFANDFPEGTILKVTAEIIIPNKTL